MPALLPNLLPLLTLKFNLPILLPHLIASLNYRIIWIVATNLYYSHLLDVHFFLSQITLKT